MVRAEDCTKLLPTRSELLWSLLLGTTTIGLLLIVAWARGIGFLERDSEEYQVFAESILHGTVFGPLDAPNAHRGLFLRSPGFPIVLALGMLLPLPQETALLIVHSLCFLAALVWFLMATRRLAPPAVSAGAVSIAALRLSDFFRSNISEWTCFCLLLILLALVLSEPWRNRPHFQPLAFGLVASMLTLVRPLFLFLAVFVPIRAWFASRRISTLTFSLVGLAPLLLWSLTNIYRTGSFSIAQVGGYNILHIAAGLPMVQSLSFVQERADPCATLAGALLPHALPDQMLPPEQRRATLGPIFQSTIIELTSNGTISWSDANSCAARFALQSIHEHPYEYTQLVWGVFLLHGIPWIELTLCCVLVCLIPKRQGVAPLLNATATALLIHIGAMGVTSLSLPIGARFEALTRVVLLIPILMLLAAWIRSAFGKSTSEA